MLNKYRGMSSIDIEVNGEDMTVYYNINRGTEGDSGIPRGTRDVFTIEDIKCPEFIAMCLDRIKEEEGLD